MSEQTNVTATIDLYCQLMGEIKFRIEAIKEVIHAKISIAGTTGKDIGYLELRMICELIALSSLVAHGDIAATRSAKIMRAYQADALISAMARLHPQFYPKPMVRRLDQEPVPSQKGGRFISPPLLASGFLTQSQLKKLYHHCGEHLHRGSLSDFMSRKNMKVDFSPIGKAVDKIVHLLDYHRIQLIDGAHEHWVEMSGPTGKPFMSQMRHIMPHR